MSESRISTDGRPERRQRRLTLALSCTACGARNYKTTRARRSDGQPLALSKFCKGCNQHTRHVETR